MPKAFLLAYIILAISRVAFCAAVLVSCPEAKVGRTSLPKGRQFYTFSKPLQLMLQ